MFIRKYGFKKYRDYESKQFNLYVFRGGDMTTEQLIKDFWPIIATGVALTVWLIRGEGKQKATDKRVDALYEMHKTESVRLVQAMDKMSLTQDKMADTISEMRTTLAGVVGYEKGAQEARKVRSR